MVHPPPQLLRASPRDCTLLLLAALVIACHASDRPAVADGDAIALAAGRTLTVGEASQLMAQNRRVTVNPQTVGVLAGLWVEYTLLDSALRADSTLRSLSLDVIAAPERDQAIIMKLRDRVIRADTSFTEKQVAMEAKARGIRLEPDRDGGEDRAKGEGEESGEAARELRRALAASAQERAEAAYLDSVVGAATIEPTDSAFDVMRSVAAHPTRVMVKDAEGRPIARYRHGVFTAGDFAHYLQVQPLERQRTLAAATREQMNDELRRLITNQLLLREASRQGVTLSTTEEQAIRDRTRRGVDSTLLFIRDLTQHTDSTTAPRRLATVLTAAISGRGVLVPLGPLGAVLRGAYPSEVIPETFPSVVRRVNELRAPASSASPGDSAAGSPRRSAASGR